MEKNIILDCERMKYPNNGLYYYCLNLGKHLLPLQQPGEQVSFYVTPENKGLFGNAPYMESHPWHKLVLPLGNFKGVWHSTHQGSPYFPSRQTKARIVLTIHDLNMLYEKARQPHLIRRQLRRIQDHINRADHIVTISEFALKDVQEHLHLDNKPITVIYNGCRVETFPGFDAPRYRPAKPFLFSIGTVLPKKNFHVLTALLVHHDYELVIAGNIRQSYLDKIMETARQHGVAARVRVIGPVDDAEKYWYYKHCVAFLFPSLAEGFGQPAVEAMTLGKPVFLSTHTSLPEIGGNAAYFFHSFEPQAMRDAFDAGMHHYETTHPQALIAARGNSFNWDQVAGRYFDVYRNVLHQ